MTLEQYEKAEELMHQKRRYELLINTKDVEFPHSLTSKTSFKIDGEEFVIQPITLMQEDAMEKIKELTRELAKI